MNMMRPLLLLLALVGACAPAAQPAALAPPEIPALIAQAQREPRNAALRFRLAAALAAARRCDTAVAVARTAQLLEPDNVRGPLVVGSCQEQGGRYDAAIATYSDFAAQHATARGVAALRAKAQLALRASAEQTARQALAREAELAQQPPQSATVAVLPVLVSGDSTYQPLSRGLAELITTDLAYIRTLRLLERLQIGVLLDELKLGASDRADPATAARVGKLLRAERMVQGVATIPPGGGGGRVGPAHSVSCDRQRCGAVGGAGDGAVLALARTRKTGRLRARRPARDPADGGRAAAHPEGRPTQSRGVPRVQQRARGDGRRRLRRRRAAVRRGDARGPELPGGRRGSTGSGGGPGAAPSGRRSDRLDRGRGCARPSRGPCPARDGRAPLRRDARRRTDRG